jgi:prolyl-tRNA editing enzyme YbaK/EbsC (Cys-tRNA(Pro) deacylase)
MSDLSSPAHQSVVAALDGIGIDYEVLPCDPSMADTEVFCAHYEIPLACSANTIVVVGKSGTKGYAACVLLADSRLDANTTVRKKLGVRRISFATADETVELTGMVLGGVTPLPLPEHVPLWVDARVMQAPYIILGGGDRATKLKVSPRLFELLPNTEIVADLARLRPLESG